MQATQQQPNARFWAYLNHDWAKLTLCPGQLLNWGWSGPTDEGWESWRETWHYETEPGSEPAIRHFWLSDGVDCDGRLARGGESICSIAELASREIEGLHVPAWQQAEEGWQRDYAAEAAGY